MHKHKKSLNESSGIFCSYFSHTEYFFSHTFKYRKNRKSNYLKLTQFDIIIFLIKTNK